ncbi:diphosphomevalonate decarboxylase [Leptobacterium sp. I13]|uniref:diphosphomevalonate/mevalonate 3,5-bisphosphate decarboxylase family protein n=1 Tax=Leptobacterium meishanense TaxID=3128904 RepID=UPI0030EF0DF9
MTEEAFIPAPYTKIIDNGTVAWKAPSNIALVKYWGKKANQIPANPSISFTLSNCTTATEVTFNKLPKKTESYSFELFFEGKPKDEFRPKIDAFFERIESYVPFIRSCHFTIKTTNSFPHSSGIASSASSMSALALCLMSIEKTLNPEITETFFKRKASFLARLGSGSACRSIEGNVVVWGNHEMIKGSSDIYGIPYPYEVHEVFRKYQDTILLVDKGVKQVSSTLGHNLMKGHPFAESRFLQAHKNLDNLRQIFKEGDIQKFIQVIESEALTLHAMMMTSTPYFILMRPNTLEIINKIWLFRKATGSKVCFTLDAGANVHLLYPEEEKAKVLEFIKNELVAYCENEQYICDCIGFGAKKI